MHPDVTFVFRDDKTYAIHQGKVIAASADLDEVERLVKQAVGDPYADFLEHGGEGGDPDEGYEGAYGPRSGQPGGCPECGGPGGTNFCPECGAQLNHGDTPHGQEMGNPYPHDEPSPGLEFGGEAGSYMAKIVTPNGLKGTVLGKVAGLWHDEVTIRLENGRIVRVPASMDLRSATKKTASAPPTAIQRLEHRLAASPDGTRDSLAARVEEVNRIAEHAGQLIREGASHADSIRLDQLYVQAVNEGLEVLAAIEHIDAAESIQAPGFSMGVAKEAAGISREDASWLDHTVDEMIKEAEATDFTKLMDEGPEAFAAELPDVALADTGVTRQMASSFIQEKTAGIQRTVADPYMITFLSRIEECRKAELATRKQTVHKEASATEDQYKDLPDDSLFL